MKHISIIPVLFFPLLLCLQGFSQTISARQLYEEYHRNEYNFEKQYLNKTITVTGKVRSVKQGVKGLNASSAAFITATGYENFISAQFPLEDTVTLSRLNAGDMITVTGTCSTVVRDAIIMKDCKFITGKTVVVQKKPAPANIPVGTYHIYQANGTTFDFQYKMLLPDYSFYTINNIKGAATYNAKTKVIRFISGKLKGFTGVYRPFNPDNEKDPPTIVIDPKGSVPDLQHQYGKTYLLAYHQE